MAGLTRRPPLTGGSWQRLSRLSQRQSQPTETLQVRAAIRADLGEAGSRLQAFPLANLSNTSPRQGKSGEGKEAKPPAVIAEWNCDTRNRL